MNYKLENKIFEVNNLTLGYGNNIIIKDFNMSESNVVLDGKNTGQIIAILGVSGRGKSTLFKGFTGLIKPIEGQILIPKDYALNEAKIVQEGDIALVDQEYTLFRHKTILESCKYALRKKKFQNEKEKIDLIEEYLNNWNLIQHKNKYPCELSGGQRQRTAILEKILLGSNYLIFDEPASGLDVVSIKKLKQSFNLISEENDLNTIIFSTHDINLAVELADSIYVIGHKNPEDTFSTLINHYDLKELGLAWNEFGLNHLELVKEIVYDLERS